MPFCHLAQIVVPASEDEDRLVGVLVHDRLEYGVRLNELRGFNLREIESNMSEREQRATRCAPRAPNEPSVACSVPPLTSRRRSSSTNAGCISLGYFTFQSGRADQDVRDLPCQSSFNLPCAGGGRGLTFAWGCRLRGRPGRVSPRAAVWTLGRGHHPAFKVN